MPANQKSFNEIQRAKFDSFRQSLRDHGFVPPYSDSGPIRSSDGTLVDLAFDEITGELNLRVRSVGKGRTYSSFFDKVETILKGITT